MRIDVIIEEKINVVNTDKKTQIKNFIDFHLDTDNDNLFIHDNQPLELSKDYLIKDIELRTNNLSYLIDYIKSDDFKNPDEKDEIIATIRRAIFYNNNDIIINVNNIIVEAVKYNKKVDTTSIFCDTLKKIFGSNYDLNLNYEVRTICLTSKDEKYF